MLLELLECFHGYVMKYVAMIIRGTLPPANTKAGRDAKEMLRTLAPRGSQPSLALTQGLCKMLHLAFKAATTEEIYDTLAFCLMRAMRQFDPNYADKTRQACEVISQLSKKQFTEADLEGQLPFDCLRILRALVRKGFLASVTGKKKVVGYKLGPAWPPPAEFFQSGPIGFVYVVQMWFRYYLKEARKGVDASLTTIRRSELSLLPFSLG